MTKHRLRMIPEVVEYEQRFISGSSSSQQSSQSTPLPKSKSDEKNPAKAKCPVCSVEVPQSEINNHLDECLQSPPPG